MKTYCVKCRKATNNINPKIFRTKDNRLLMQSTCSDCKNKKSRFVKEHKAKDFVRKTQSDKVLRDKAFNIARDPKQDGYQRGLVSVVYKFLKKRSSGGSSTNESNYQLADELHKPIIRKFKKTKVYLSFRDNIWGVDLADMQLLCRYKKRIKYLLCAVDLFSKYGWVIPMKEKKVLVQLMHLKK